MNALFALVVLAAAPHHVLDDAGVFSPAAQARLESELSDFQKRWGVEVDVITEGSLDGLTPEDRTSILGVKWGVGDHTRDQGVVVGFFRYDRRIAINLSKGIHGITPSDCKQIIDGTMIPRFKAGAYEDGIAQGTLAVEHVLEGQPVHTAQVPYSPPAAAYQYRGNYSSRGGLPCLGTPLFVLLIIVVALLRVFLLPGSYYYGSGYGWGRGWSSWSSGSSWGSGSSWSSGSSSGSSWGGSSSTFSGGGGGWSGGGASGSW